jgi:cell division protein FtsL
MVQESSEPKRRTRPKKAEQVRRLVRLTETQAALGWGVILILVALLGAIYLNQASRIASIGRRVQTLQIQVDNVKRENASMEREIAESQALDRLQREAVRLGFRRARAEDIEYVVVPDYPALVPAVSRARRPAPPPPPPEPVERIQDALWLAVRASVTDLMRGESP